MNKASKKEQFAQQFQESEANYSYQNQPGPEAQDQSQGKPIQLIRILPTGKIQICEEALSIIGSIDEPVGFVSLVGKTRTGKSCLLNKILHISGDGFKVDSSTNSCTDGIWMWSEPYFNNQFKSYVFFLDTEGTDSLVKDAQNDTKIFTLALLLSTYFIYNSVGTINEVALSELEMVTALSKYIKTGGESTQSSENNQIHRFMPKFMWLLRDFMLKLEDDRGRRISASQYLENCLNDRKASEQSRKIKKSIMSYFPNRECLTLVQPVDDEYQLQRLNQLPEQCLRREFLEGVNTLRNKIMANTGPKLYEGKPITGYSLSVMIDSYVQAFNSGKVPNIKTAWEQIAEDEGATAFNKALERFEQIFNDQFKDNEPKGEDIYKTIFRLKQETLKEYETHTYNNKNDAYSKKLKVFLESKEKEILEENKKANQLRNYEILNKHAQKLRSRIESNYYMTNKNTREEIKDDIEEVSANYKKQARGQNKGELLTEFINVVTPLVLNMKADNTEEMERLKQAQIAMREQQRKIRQLQQEKASKDQQLISQQNANAIKVQKKSSKKDKEKQDRDQGCCAGGKCEIM